MVFLQRMESDAVNRLLSLVPVLYGLTLFILFFSCTMPTAFSSRGSTNSACTSCWACSGASSSACCWRRICTQVSSRWPSASPAALLISEAISLVTARLVGLGIVAPVHASLSAIVWTAVGFLLIKLLASLILQREDRARRSARCSQRRPRARKSSAPPSFTPRRSCWASRCSLLPYALRHRRTRMERYALYGARAPRSAWRHCCCFTGCASSSTSWPARRPRGQTAGI